jgi:hypothetical protein
MAEIVLTDCFIEIDATEFSGKNTNVAISYSAEALDITAMGDDTRKNVGGLKDWSMAMEFIADESVTGVFFDKVGTVIPVEVRASSAARSATNPGYMGDALITEYTPLGGGVGELQKVSLSLVSAGPLARNVEAV